MSERGFRSKIQKELARINGYAGYSTADAYSNGVSDLIACFRGRMIACEFKDDKGKASAVQRRFLEKFRLSGAVVGVMRPSPIGLALRWEEWTAAGFAPPHDYASVYLWIWTVTHRGLNE